MQSPPVCKTVLCVDDDVVILQLLKTVLRARGYLALAASDGRQALKIAASLRLDVVILDYFMPGMNGAEVAVQIKRIQPQTPIILFSGSLHSLPPTLPGVTAWVEKGDGLHSLLAVVARMVEVEAPRAPVRRFPRYPVQLPFAILTDRAGRVTMLQGVCKSVGEGGLGGQVDGNLEPGERVLILIPDPRLEAPLESRAQVRYHSGDTYGFEFVDVSPGQQAEVRHLCQQLASV